MLQRRLYRAVGAVIALTIGAATVQAATASAAPAPRARTSITFAANHSKIGVNSRPSFRQAVSGAPRGSKFSLQRTAGTHAVWRVVRNVTSRKGTVVGYRTVLGKYQYRIAVTTSRKLVATSKSRTVFVYGNVSLKTLCNNDPDGYDCNGGTEQVGENLWAYQIDVQAPLNSWEIAIKYGKTSCRSLTVSFAGDESIQADGGTSNMKVVQTATDAKTVSTTSGHVGTLTTALDGGPFAITVMQSDPDDEWYDIYATGNASCYTDNGKR